MPVSTRTMAVIAAALTSCSVPAAAVAPSGDPVLFWNELMLGASYNPGQTRPAAMLGIALHDTVNATLGRPNNPFLGMIPVQGGDTRAATAVAARDLLVNLIPGRAAEFNAAMAVQLALVADGPAKTAGMATGATIAAATLANRAADGAFAPSAYIPSGLPGRWAPTPPGFAPAAAPQQATMKTWLGMANDQFRLGPPPTLDSAEYTAAFNEVKAIGAVGSARTADQSQSALFWAAAAGPGPWIRAVIDQSEARGLSTLENAAIIGRLATGIGDSTIAVWDSKYHYDYWRPVTAIRGADGDGNPDTAADAGWTPFIGTPAHPSYASAHAAVGGAASTILNSFFGSSTQFCLLAAGINRCWDSFSSAADDGAMSRLWGGIHWRFDNERGLDLGRNVGNYALAASPFGVVPEPATWAMLISGFGLTGLIARRRRRVQAC
jgi:PAP2 superfamily/PEP-CTERM motif